MKKIIYILVFILPFLGIGQTIRYASATGSGAANGTSEANAWSYAQAFANATGHMTVHVKAGSVSTNGFVVSGSGSTASNRLVFKGYISTPGDVSASTWSTFVRTNTSTFPSSSNMPYLVGPDTASKYGIIVSNNYVTIENFQLRDYDWAVIANGLDVLLKNVITYSCNSGFLLNRTSSNGGTVRGCYILNSGNTGINMQGGKGYKVEYTRVHSDDPASQFPGDPNPLQGYYFATTLGARDNIIENCIAYRIPDDNGTYHQGHGFIAKADSQNNTYRNSVAYNTGIECNFEDVRLNTFENIEIYGNYSSYSNQFSSCIRIINGASENVFKNIYIEDTRYAFNFHDFDDGYTPSPDTDAVQGGHDNLFVNVVVNKMNTLISYTESPASNATSSNNTWLNCTFYDSNGGGGLINGDQVVTGERFINCIFNDFSNPYMSDVGGNGSLSLTFSYSNFSSNSFTTPSGTSITTYSPLFDGPLTSAEGFKLQASSNLIDIGQTQSDASEDYEGKFRPIGSGYDLGAFEYGAGGGGDVTAPTVTSVTVSEITSNSARITWYLNEGATGHLDYGTTASYGTSTAHESSFLTGHSQVISGLSASTTYHYNIVGEDAAGNDIVVTDRTFTTLAGEDPEPDPPVEQLGVISRFIKKNKF